MSLSIAPFDFSAPSSWLRLGIAAVWLLFGLVFKALDGMPRHRRIVARVVGEQRAGLVTNLVALGEVSIAMWLVWGHLLVLCAAVQTAALVAMNGLEIKYARDLLLSPVAMVCANLLLLTAGWYLSLS